MLLLLVDCHLFLGCTLIFTIHFLPGIGWEAESHGRLFLTHQGPSLPLSPLTGMTPTQALSISYHMASTSSVPPLSCPHQRSVSKTSCLRACQSRCFLPKTCLVASCSLRVSSQPFSQNPRTAAAFCLPELLPLFQPCQGAVVLCTSTFLPLVFPTTPLPVLQYFSIYQKVLRGQELAKFPWFDSQWYHLLPLGPQENNFSVPQFSHLQNRYNSSTNLTGFL